MLEISYNFLKQFCAGQEYNSSRFREFEEPYVYENNTYVSDCKICLRFFTGVPGVKIESSPLTTNKEHCIKFFEIGKHEKILETGISIKADDLKYTVCPNCNGKGETKIEGRRCPECSGDGEVFFSNRYSSYEVDCKTCDGVGKLYGEDAIDDCTNCNGKGKFWVGGEKFVFNESYFSKEQLYRLVQLPNLKLYLNPDKPKEGIAYITFDGGDGVIMPQYPY